MKKERDWIEIKASKLWSSIKNRCGTNSGYVDVKVSNDWLCFDNFHKWFREQVDNGWYKEGWEIDKDIISSGGRLYSSENCAFIPTPLNRLFVKAFNRDNIFSTRGVSKVYDPKQWYEDVIFKSEINYDGKTIFYGEYDYELFAFFEYKWAFEEFVQNIAEELKTNLHPKMYEALINHRVLPR
jgi:hypothetical protein